MGIALYLGFVVAAIALVMWGRHVWQKHEAESIYENDPRSESHKQDPFFQSTAGDGFHGGSGGSLL